MNATYFFLIFALFQAVYLEGLSLPIANVQSTQMGSAASQKTEKSFLENIELSPLVLSNHDLGSNSLKGSAYELLNNSKSSILLLSFSFSDPEIIRIINQKASEGIDVHLVIDRDHLSGCRGQLHPSIQMSTRTQGEGHLHHKILVIDRQFIWVGSGNFTPSAFTSSKNLAIGFSSPEIGAALHQEALDIASSRPRSCTSPFSCVYENQLLELYVLPHNPPEAPRAVETMMNEKGKDKLLSLINNARHHIKISVDVWTYKEASQAIIRAMQRGVHLDICTGDLTTDAVKLMTQNGILVKQGISTHYKFMLVDHKTLLCGSPNWSMNAFSRSDESLIVLDHLTEGQLNALEGPLKAAGLPTPLQLNETEESDDSIHAASNDESSEKAESVKRTIARLNDEIIRAPMSQENQRLISIATRLSNDLIQFIPYLKTAPVPGCCLYDGNNYLATVIAIAEKQERVEAAFKYIKQTSGIDQKVHDYFQKKLNQLASGINAPLPDYFHATRTGLASIIAGQTILQSSTGLTGPGTYISCNNEGEHGYGNHTFAIDEGCLIDTAAIFRTGRHPMTNVFFSLWASVIMDIPVNEESIAFIDTALQDVPYVRALLEQKSLNIDVLDRNTAENILRIFDLTTKRRELPSFHWRKSDIQDYLPQNMFPRSPQGTFRPFFFSRP